MFLLAAATELELAPLAELLSKQGHCLLKTGVGLVETTLSLTRFLESPQGKSVTGVINFGVAGAFVDSGATLLDVCLAESERLADLGVCYGDRVETFDSLDIPNYWDADSHLLAMAGSVLQNHNIVWSKGPFITVNAVSATDERAFFYREQYGALCENMEGAAVMRVCSDFGLPCLEIRSISNFVKKRDTSKWKLEEAAEQCAKAIALIVEFISSKP